MRVEKDFEDFIKLLNEKKVRYLIIGAYAVSFYARPRFTGDMDFFIDNSSDNTKKILQVLVEFGFGSLNLTEQDFEKDSVIQLGYEPNRIDILSDISGVQFKPAFANRVEGTYGDETVFFISLEDLITNKKASNRLQDKTDLELLKKFKNK